MSAAGRNPYVVGQWVRGERFYGRRKILETLLGDPGVSRWVLGTRRIGKTSLLRQVEHLVATAEPESRWTPLFWDLQGADNPTELRLSLQDALLDAEELLESRGIPVQDLEPLEPIALLERLRDGLARSGRRLLLLVDEAEELLALSRADPALVGRLASLMGPAGGLTMVLASSVRLRQLTGRQVPERTGDSGTLPPPLEGLLPPLALGPLEDEEAVRLVLQTALPAERRPEIDAGTATEICRRSGNHPYLLQLLSKRFFELGDLAEAEARIAEDRMVAKFLEVDFEMLDPDERGLLQALAESSHGLPQPAPEAVLWLENLGLVTAGPEGTLEVPNPLFRRWLTEIAAATTPAISADDVTHLSRILSEKALSRVGDELTAQGLAELVYDELRDLAGRYMRRERREHTLQPTALVHEAYLKLADQSRVDWQGRTHFLAVGAQAMRRILIDHARGRGRAKRGAEWFRVPLLEEILPGKRRGLDAASLMDLDRAVDRLAAREPRQARVVELRFFAGLEVAEVAELLGVSKRTVEGDWARARDWLRQELAVEPDPS